MGPLLGESMAVIKRIIKHVSVDIARGDRRCRRDAKHTIRPGKPCLTIQDEGTPFKRSYCAECALPILKLCASELRQIRDALYPQGIAAAPEIPEQSVGQALVAKNRKSRQSKVVASVSESVEQSESDDEIFDSQSQIKKAAR